MTQLSGELARITGRVEESFAAASASQQDDEEATRLLQAVHSKVALLEQEVETRIKTVVEETRKQERATASGLLQHGEASLPLL